MNMYVTTAGFYPSILRVDHPSQKYAQTIGGAFEIDGDPSKLKFFDRHKGGRRSVSSACYRSCGTGWLCCTPDADVLQQGCCLT